MQHDLVHLFLKIKHQIFQDGLERKKVISYLPNHYGCVLKVNLHVPISGYTAIHLMAAHNIGSTQSQKIFFNVQIMH